MLDAPPRESECCSWLYVTLWSLVVFFTIPFARAVREIIADRIGLQFFLYTAVFVALAGGAVALASVRRRDLPTSAYLWLIGVTAAFVSYAYYLRDIPEEAIHVAEYGFLGLLVYRALVHRIRDYSIYFIATLVVGLVGMVDEYIQWVVPTRVFDLRDIRTNFIAGALSQVAIAGGLRPKVVAGTPSAKSLGRLCRVAALSLFVLGLSYVNTPKRVAWYARHVPALSFLLDSKSMMVDYGHLHRDPEIGVFKSRFTAEQLERYDRQRGVELAKILDEYFDGGDYDAFQNAYSVPRDPYVHEAGVHLFRRNRHFERATANEESRSGYATIALRENQILEKYFPTAMAHSTQAWTPEIHAFADAHAVRDEVYESYVSRDLMTRFSEKQAVLAFSAGIAALLLLGAVLGKGGRGRIPSSEGLRQ